jgi:hypothetical protein
MRSVLISLLFATAAAAQEPASHAMAAQPQLPRDEISKLARLQVAINTAHDSANIQLAAAKNMTPQAQQSLRERLDEQLADIYRRAGMSEVDFRRKAFVLSSDGASRRVFDSVVVAVTGAPLPGTYVPPATPVRAQVAVPAGAAGVHIAHVMNAFGDTPSGVGLLTMAMEEARVAATHAQLATRQPGNLDYMKTHAGHVINALDPTIVPTGPGLKYGLRKAALGVATHIELASAADGATLNMQKHAPHVAMAARNTISRADSLIVLAQKIQAAATAAEAAPLTTQLASLAEQLIPGFDMNADGKIGVGDKEGGLQLCDEHVRLMLAP